MSIHFPSEKKSSSSYIVDDASPPISTQQQDTKTPYADLNNSGDIASTSEPPLDAPPSYDAAPSISSHLQGHLAFNLNAPYFAFHVYRDSLFNHDLTIMTPDKSMVAYTMKTSSTSPMAKPPHVRVWRGPRELHASTSPWVP